MAKITQQQTSGGIGIIGVLWIVLIVLKILGELSMGWFQVLTSCIWIPTIIILGILAVVGIVIGILWLINKIFNK